MGFGASSSKAENAGNVWETQSPFLENMWNRGQNLVGQQMQPGQNGELMVRQMMPQMQNAFSSLMSPGSNPQLSNYAGQLGREFQQNIMPGINRGAQGVSQLGGGRQGVAEGIAGGQMGQQMADFAGNQYSNDMNRMLQGLGQAQGMFNFGQSPMTASWMPLQQQAGLLGAPTVLNSGSSSSRSFQASI